MAKLNLNFYETTDRREPTKSEILDLELIALGAGAIAKALRAYSMNYHDTPDFCADCAGVCNVLEILMDPNIEYFSEYAGSAAPPDKEGKT